MESCLHTNFLSQRGLRKHINQIHTWYYYFDKQPYIDRTHLSPIPEKVFEKKAMFSVSSGIGKELCKWLEHPAGGDKTEKEAEKVAKRAMKYLMFCLGDNNEESISEAYVDCCLGSPTMVLSFVKAVGEDWQVGSSCSLTYVDAVQALMNYRKTCSVSNEVLRSFISTEVYLRNSCRSFRRRKKIEYVRNLGVEKLIAKNSWATIDEMERVIPFHSERFTDVCRACSDKSADVSNVDLAFATRFLIAFLFLRVKSTRPMSYQFLTLEMFKAAKDNGGFVDQREFKTNKEYIFDTIIFPPPVIDILQKYIDIIRPRCVPTCEYVLVNNNGKQFYQFSHAMNLLTFEAIGKVINPTRWRMIIESESSVKLCEKDQQTITDDQKHSSTVAKVSYRKRQSREVATEGLKCVKKLTGNAGDIHSLNMAEELNSIIPTEQSEEEQNEKDGEKTISISDTEDEKDKVIKPATEVSLTDPVHPVDTTITTNEPSICMEPDEIKVEDAEEGRGEKGKKGPKYTKEEDAYLKQGITKYGKSNWSRILRDPEYKFHPKRTRDGLRMRATTLRYVVKKKGKDSRFVDEPKTTRKGTVRSENIGCSD